MLATLSVLYVVLTACMHAFSMTVRIYRYSYSYILLAANGKERKKGRERITKIGFSLSLPGYCHGQRWIEWQCIIRLSYLLLLTPSYNQFTWDNGWLVKLYVILIEFRLASTSSRSKAKLSKVVDGYFDSYCANLCWMSSSNSSINFAVLFIFPFHGGCMLLANLARELEKNLRNCSM